MLDSGLSSPGYSPPEVVAATSFVEMPTVSLSTQVYKDASKLMLVVIRGSRNTVCGFILWKLEICSDLAGHFRLERSHEAPSTN